MRWTGWAQPAYNKPRGIANREASAARRMHCPAVHIARPPRASPARRLRTPATSSGISNAHREQHPHDDPFRCLEPDVSQAKATFRLKNETQNDVCFDAIDIDESEQHAQAPRQRP
jgi:flagellar basal body rod protein FlgC